MMEVYPGLVAACGRKYTDPQRGAKRARRWTPVMALAVWQLVRHLDTPGTGRVHLAALRAAALALWTRDSFYRHLRDAESIGLVHVTTRKRDGIEVIEARGIVRVAELLELPSVGARKVSIPLASLKSAKSFKRALWAAWHAGRSHNTGAPVTRTTLQKLSGMAPSTQRAYERTTPNAAGGLATDATQNTVILATDATPGALAAAREFVHGGCYIDRHTRALLRPIGNTFETSLTAGSRSRARKVNRLLSHRPGALLPPGSPKRLFFVDPAKAERAARGERAEDVPLAPTGQRAAGGAVLWARVWDSWSLAHVAGV